jgi:hypothetical protein
MISQKQEMQNSCSCACRLMPQMITYEKIQPWIAISNQDAARGVKPWKHILCIRTSSAECERLILQYVELIHIRSWSAGILARSSAAPALAAWEPAFQVLQTKRAIIFMDLAD